MTRPRNPIRARERLLYRIGMGHAALRRLSDELGRYDTEKFRTKQLEIMGAMRILLEWGTSIQAGEELRR